MKKALLCGIVALATPWAQSLEQPAREKLIGAWRLVYMEEQGPDGRIHKITGRKGMLVYTRDGHVSVQLMFPETDAARNSDYAQGGYEASLLYDSAPSPDRPAAL